MYSYKTFLTEKEIAQAECIRLKHFGNGRFLIFYATENTLMCAEYISYRIEANKIYILDSRTGYLYCAGGPKASDKIYAVSHVYYSMYDSQIKHLELEINTINKNGESSLFNIIVDWISPTVFKCFGIGCNK